MAGTNERDRDPGAALAELQARQRRFEEIQKQSKQELDQIRADPNVRQLLDDYARDYGDGDPTWWKPEYEASDAGESERMEHVVAAVPQPIRELSETIAKVVIDRSAEQLERLSSETGITVADLRALDTSVDAVGGDATRRSHVALRIAKEVHAIDHAVAQYGLDRSEFQALPSGPEDRTAGTMVGRQQRVAPKKLQAAPQAITGTAKLDVPSEVEARAAAASSKPMPKKRRRTGLWAVLLASLAAVVIIVVAFSDDPRETTTHVTSAKPDTSPSERSSAKSATPAVASSVAVPAPAVEPSVAVESAPQTPTPRTLPLVPAAPKSTEPPSPTPPASPPTPPPSAPPTTSVRIHN